MLFGNEYNFSSSYATSITCDAKKGLRRGRPFSVLFFVQRVVKNRKNMSAISPQDVTLSDQINRDLYRQRLAAMSTTFSSMDRYITNLKSDLQAIATFQDDLERQRRSGYDVGSSIDTLTFQQTQLHCDLKWFEQNRRSYIEKLYSDLYKFAVDVAQAAAQIEERNGDTVEALRDRKLQGARVFDDSNEYGMGDVESLLSLVERLLMELAGDVASIDPKIADAEAKQKRGFSIGNLIVNLTSQKVKLSTEFSATCARIENFLALN